MILNLLFLLGDVLRQMMRSQHEDPYQENEQHHKHAHGDQQHVGSPRLCNEPWQFRVRSRGFRSDHEVLLGFLRLLALAYRQPSTQRFVAHSLDLYQPE